MNTEDISVYPNPASEYLDVNVSKNISTIKFELYNLQGQKVLTKELKGSERITLEPLNSGTYLFKINVDDRSVTGKLLIK